MSDVSTELTRIENAKAGIKTAIGTKGVVIPDTALLDDYPGYINKIDVDIELSTLNATENGTYTPAPGYTGFSSVTVAIPEYEGGVANG